MEWQPIETAPIGVDILFFCKNTEVPWTKLSVGQTYHQPKSKYHLARQKCLFRVGNQLLKRGTAIPTHWMPLPAQPSEATQ